MKASLTDEQMKKFQELFGLSDIYAMQFALECEYGIGSELARKLEKFLEEVNEENSL
ncbi:hypothetical protein [Bacillus infantis]|uniref:hypothetical protein n=1 Tax=Bacillus infantis TaxID=324767 RepID=UPI003CF67FD8